MAPKLDNPQFTYASTQLTPESFFSRRRSVVRDVTLLYQLRTFRETGRYDAFDLKWKDVYGDVDKETGVRKNRHLFWDSDVGKWIEGVMCFENEEGESGAVGEEKGAEEEVRKAVEELVGKIERAQMEDGYLNIHYQVVEKGKRWTNLRDMHELYNAGHLIEAAIIHSQSPDKRLLKVMEKYVGLMKRNFGPDEGQLHGYPGHPELELALIRLYKATNEKSYLDLAKYFLEERGKPDPHYYDVEAKKRGERPNERPAPWPERRAYWYQQAHKPILEQETVEGHSVRAMYLLTAVADLATLDGDFRAKYEPALNQLWNNMVGKKMYLTGGIGAMDQWEGFGIDYFLPQATDEGGCYSETCAQIGVMMLANRMLQLDLNRKYSDILELCLFNSVLTGMSLDGKAFTYENQLASSSGRPSKREEWFDCACCPPNMVRTLGYLGGYVWDVKDTVQSSNAAAEINVHLYTACTLKHAMSDGTTISLEQKTDFPWSGDVEFTLKARRDVVLRLRIPGWAKDWKITPSLPNMDLVKGYLTLPSGYLSNHPCFKISFPMSTRLIRPHPYANQPIVAVARGAMVYCIEDVDHPWVEDHFKSLLFHPTTTANFHEIVKSDLPSGESYVAIEAPHVASFLPKRFINEKEDEPSPFYYVDGSVIEKEIDEKKRVSLTFVPFYVRANRGGRGMMRVGLRVPSVF